MPPSERSACRNRGTRRTDTDTASCSTVTKGISLSVDRLEARPPWMMPETASAPRSDRRSSVQASEAGAMLRSALRPWLPSLERGRQQQLALGNGDDAVAQAVESEPGTTSLADARMEMMPVTDLAGCTGRRQEHPGAASGRSAAAAGRRSRMGRNREVMESSGGAPVSVCQNRKTSASMATRSRRNVNVSSRHIRCRARTGGRCGSPGCCFSLHSGAPARRHLRQR